MNEGLALIPKENQARESQVRLRLLAESNDELS